MSRDGSGNYSLPAGNPVSTGTTISSTWANNTLSDIATALTQSISKDGQTTYTANQPMGGNKHTSIANATARDQYAAFGQVQDGAAQYLTSVAGTNTITASLGSLAAYAAGQRFAFVAANTNTGAVTININGLGARDITKQGTTALVSGDIPAGVVVNIVYDGTRFQLVAVPAVLSLTGLTVSGSSSLSTTTISGTLSQTATSGGDFVVNTSSAAGAEAAMRLTASDASSGIALKLSNSSLNKQAAVRGRSDGGITVYVNQTSGGGSTSGTQAADIDASGFFNAVRVSENATRVFSRNAAFVSAEQTVTASSSTTVAHGLGGIPALVRLVLRCKTAEAGYAVNEEIDFNYNSTAGGAVQVSSDATNCYIVQNFNVNVVNKAAPGTISAITPGNWRWVVRAWF